MGKWHGMRRCCLQCGLGVGCPRMRRGRELQRGGHDDLFALHLQGKRMRDNLLLQQRLRIGCILPGECLQAQAIHRHELHFGRPVPEHLLHRRSVLRGCQLHDARQYVFDLLQLD